MNKYFYLIGAGLLGIALWLFFRHYQKGRDAQIGAPILAPGVKEKIIIDPRKHTMIAVTKNETHSVTLPDRPSAIEITTTGKVRITSPQFGTELDPFVGVAYSLHGGLVGGGVDFFYWKRLDLGMGVLVNPVSIQDTTIFAGLSYFVYSNTSVALGLDNHQTPVLIVKVRL